MSVIRTTRCALVSSFFLFTGVTYYRERIDTVLNFDRIPGPKPLSANTILKNGNIE